MIDTLKFIAPITKALLNAILAEIKDTPAMNYRFIWKRVQTEFGSFKLRISIENQTMEMELSPMKYLKGHNLFGTNLPQPLILGILEVIYDHFQLQFTEKDQAFYKQHDFTILRSDLTGGFLVGSQNKVVDTMGLVREHLLAHGYDVVVHEGHDGIETLYLGKSSSHSTVKFYNKYRHILATSNSASKALPYFSELIRYSEKVVRIEFTLRSRVLKDYGLKNLKAWRVSKVREILEAELHKLGLSGQLLAELPEDVAAGLNGDKLRKYRMWSDEIDMLNYYSPETFERDRKFFHERGLDIARPHTQALDSVLLSSRLSVEKLKMTYPKRFVDLGAVYK